MTYIGQFQQGVNITGTGGQYDRNIHSQQSTYFNNELKRVPLKAGMTTPWMDVVSASVPESQSMVVPDAGHFTMIEAARTVREEISRFAITAAQGRK